MAKRQWIMRSFTGGEDEPVRELFHLSFGKELGLDRWKWLYKTNPAGEMRVTVAEDDNGVMVGQCALKPVRMKVGNSICLGAQSLDAMVHPDFRGQGIFTKLSVDAYHEAGEQGISLVYGFPNKNSHYILTHKLNRVNLWEVPPLLVRILNARSVLSRWLSNRFLLSLTAMVAGVFLATLRLVSSVQRDSSQNGLDRFQINEVSRFDERVNELWDKASKLHGIMVVRDKDYLNWRYAENPEEEYCILLAEEFDRVVGYAVLKCEERFGLQSGQIVDVLSDPDLPRVGEHLISEAILYFQKRNMDIVGCLMFSHVAYSKVLLKMGFLRIPSRLVPQELHLSARRLSSQFSEQMITDPKNWFVTWGDHDVI